jgi:hypothetical protein
MAELEYYFLFFLPVRAVQVPLQTTVQLEQNTVFWAVYQNLAYFTNANSFPLMDPQNSLNSGEASYDWQDINNLNSGTVSLQHVFIFQHKTPMNTATPRRENHNLAGT